MSTMTNLLVPQEGNLLTINISIRVAAFHVTRSTVNLVCLKTGNFSRSWKCSNDHIQQTQQDKYGEKEPLHFGLLCNWEIP